MPEAEREIGLNQQRLGLNQEAKEHLERSLHCYLDQDDQRNAAFVQMDLGFMEMNEGRLSLLQDPFISRHISSGKIWGISTSWLACAITWVCWTI